MRNLQEYFIFCLSIKNQTFRPTNTKTVAMFYDVLFPQKYKIKHSTANIFTISF